MALSTQKIPLGKVTEVAKRATLGLFQNALDIVDTENRKVCYIMAAATYYCEC